MRFFEVIISTFFPARCLGCKKDIAHQSLILCESCKEKIIIPQTLFCGQCGNRLPNREKICHHSIPYVLGSVFLYEDPLAKNMILALKFKRMESVGVFLGKLLAQYVKNVFNHDVTPLHGMIVIPIPLSRERFRERGFNQAALLAQSFAEELNLSVEENVLTRRRHTKPQSQTKQAKDRIQNVKEVFEVIHSHTLKGKDVVLIDDVTTTGATLESASHVLREAGAKKIIALTVAR